MTVKELKDKRDALDYEILMLIRKFESETEVSVTAIDTTTIRDYRGMDKIARLHIIIEIP